MILGVTDFNVGLKVTPKKINELRAENLGFIAQPDSSGTTRFIAAKMPCLYTAFWRSNCCYASHGGSIEWN